MTRRDMARNILVGAVLAVGIAICAASAEATPIVANGDFATSDFTGWNLTTTTNGTLGSAPYPDVTGINPFGAPHAAEFNVGQVNAQPGISRGGSLSQTIHIWGGTVLFSADIATVNQTELQQQFGGLFEV